LCGIEKKEGVWKTLDGEGRAAFVRGCKSTLGVEKWVIHVCEVTDEMYREIKRYDLDLE
jgi:hypothetical protein